MTPGEIWRSSTVRTGVGAALLSSIVMSIVFAVVYLELREELHEGLQSQVRDQLGAFEAVSKTADFPTIVDMVEARSRVAHVHDAILLLVDGQGQRVAGNIEQTEVFEEWRLIEPPALEEDHRFHGDDRFLARWVQLGDQGRLLIGLSDDLLEETQEAILSGIVLGTLCTTGLSIVAAFWLARRKQRRIDAIGAGLTHFSRSEMRQRIPVQGNGDDLDAVTDQINRMFDEVEALVDSLRQVSADIAHELKTPLTRLQQRLDLALSNASSVDEFRDANERALFEIKQIVGTFEALLRIAQIESGAPRSGFQQLDLTLLLQEILEIYSDVVEDAGDTIDGRLAAGDARINADRSLLLQLFANLIENSIRHCPPRTHISLLSEVSQDRIVVEVRDNGPGIPAGEREKVFRRLYQLDKDKARSSEGTGLGLSLVQAIAKLHGANVTLSDNDPGVLVRVQFPRDKGFFLQTDSQDNA